MLSFPQALRYMAAIRRHRRRSGCLRGGAGRDRNDHGHGEGCARRRHSRRDRHHDQRHARHDVGAGRHQLPTAHFVVPNIAADTYTIQVEMPSFRTLRRTGIVVSSGSIVDLGTITIDVGGTAEVVTVTAETPLVQTASGERSFTVTTESVANLPLAGRTFEQLLVARARRRRDARRTESGDARRRRWRRQLHARRRDGDGPRHQPPGHAHQRRIAGGSPTGRPRPTRRNTRARPACRSTPSPRAAPTSSAGRSTTPSATPSGTRTARPTSSTATRSR